MSTGRSVDRQTQRQGALKPAEPVAEGCSHSSRHWARGHAWPWWTRAGRYEARFSPSGLRTGSALRMRQRSLPRRLRPPHSLAASARLLLPVSRAASSPFPARAVPCRRGPGFLPSLLFRQPLDFIVPSVSSPSPPRPTDSSFSIWPLIRLLLIFPPEIFFPFFSFLFSFCFSLSLFHSSPCFPPLLSPPAKPPRPAARHANHTRPNKAPARPGRPRPADSRLIRCLPALAAGEVPTPTGSWGGGERSPSTGRRRCSALARPGNSGVYCWANSAVKTPYSCPEREIRSRGNLLGLRHYLN